jgi:hypothetical protein
VASGATASSAVEMFERVGCSTSGPAAGEWRALPVNPLSLPRLLVLHRHPLCALPPRPPPRGPFLLPPRIRLPPRSRRARLWDTDRADASLLRLGQHKWHIYLFLSLPHCTEVTLLQPFKLIFTMLDLLYKLSNKIKKPGKEHTSWDGHAMQ